MITWNCARPFQHEAIFANVWPTNKMIHPHFLIYRHRSCHSTHQDQWHVLNMLFNCDILCFAMPYDAKCIDLVNSQKTAHGIKQRMTVVHKGLSDVRYWMSCFTTKVGLQQSWWPNYQLNNLVYCIVYNIVYNTNLKLSWCDCQYCILNTSTNTVYYILYCI